MAMDAKLEMDTHCYKSKILFVVCDLTFMAKLEFLVVLGKAIDHYLILEEQDHKINSTTEFLQNVECVISKPNLGQKKFSPDFLLLSLSLLYVKYMPVFGLMVFCKCTAIPLSRINNILFAKMRQ